VNRIASFTSLIDVLKLAELTVRLPGAWRLTPSLPSAWSFSYHPGNGGSALCKQKRAQSVRIGPPQPWRNNKVCGVYRRLQKSCHGSNVLAQQWAIHWGRKPRDHPRTQGF